jgi:hypothetical protein
LESLNDCIVKDTIIVFDEWYYNCVNIEENRQHEQRAFFDWVAKYGRHYWIRSHVEDERIIIKME